MDKDCPISINPITGQLSTLRMLDRELEATHVFQVKAQEEPSGASPSCLLILFLLNNRISDKILEPCVFSENGNVHKGRELQRPERTVCSFQLLWI